MSPSRKLFKTSWGARLQRASQVVQRTGKRASARVRSSPKAAIALVAGVAIFGVGGWMGARYLRAHHHPLSLPSLMQPPTVAELQKKAKAAPNDARVRLELGHALFHDGRRAEGIHAYDRALALDKQEGDATMDANLLDCFGRHEQADAASLIARYKRVGTSSRLEGLAHNHSYKVRWGAVHTLEKLGRVPSSVYVSAWIQDLDSSDCEVRQHAMEALGKEGDKHALAAIRQAKEKDKTTRSGFLMFSHTCLGDRADEAEKQILARK